MVGKLLPGSRMLFLLFWLLGGILLAFIVMPLLNLFFGQSVTVLQTVAGMPDVRASIILSMVAAVITAVIAAVGGIPLAYLLARHQVPLQPLVEAVVNLPLAVPHTVAGIALLFMFGRTGFFGRIAGHYGISFWGTILGVIVGMLFVSLPYMVNSAREGFESVDLRLEKAARTLGCTPAKAFWCISLPLALPNILSGLALTYARSLAEFGAVIVLAYYPETAPVKIYELFLSGGLDQASAAAVLLLTVALTTFILFRFLANRRNWRKETR